MREMEAVIDDNEGDGSSDEDRSIDDNEGDGSSDEDRSIDDNEGDGSSDEDRSIDDNDFWWWQCCYQPQYWQYETAYSLSVSHNLFVTPECKKRENQRKKNRKYVRE